MVKVDMNVKLTTEQERDLLLRSFEAIADMLDVEPDDEKMFLAIEALKDVACPEPTHHDTVARQYEELRRLRQLRRRESARDVSGRIRREEG